jgi:HlyD family secretion protein
MKRALIILAIVLPIIVVSAVVSLAVIENRANRYSSYETETIERTTLTTFVEANGKVLSNQSAILFWKVSGKVGEVLVKTGDWVSEGDILATTVAESLPAYIVAAQAELIAAEKQLEDLLTSDRQKAEALKEVDEAQKALEDALYPELVQAKAMLDLAETKEALELAEHNYKLVTAPTPVSAVNAAYSNLLLAEDNIVKTEEAIVDAQNKDLRAVANSGVLEPQVVENLRSDIRELIKQLEFALTQSKVAYQQSLEKYNELLAPKDPVDIALAESELNFAIASYNEAQREWDRVKDGFSEADVSVLEAELNNALREYERIKDGPHPDDITELEAKIAASEAAITQRNIDAPFSGTITRVHTQAQDVVNPGIIAFQLDDLSKLSVILSISEVDVNRIAVGKDVVLTFDSLPGQEFLGKVSNIPSVGTRMFGTTDFLITAEIISPEEGIRPGMTASAKIIIGEIVDTVTVPGKSIHGLNDQLVVYKLIERVNYQLPSLGLGDRTESEESSFLGLEELTWYEIQPVTLTLGTTSGFYNQVLTGDVQPGDIVILNYEEEDK